MTVAISKTVQGIEPSATLAMAAKARELKAAGRTIYDFSLGEPDFDTPAHICQAAQEAMRSGKTHYTAASGIPELKSAVVKQYAERHGLEFSPQQVVVSNGAKHALHNAFTAVLNPGDEVVIPAPYWVSYADLVKLTGGVPKIVTTREDNDFKLTGRQLREAITPKTRMLLLCSPSNPTGSIYSRDELGELADVATEKDLLVITDEIYERLVYDQHKFAAFATLRPGLAERTITVNGVSKAYAMTGWRIGWTISPLAVAKAIDNLQSQETSCPSSVSQYAAVAALTGPQQCVDEMLQQFAARREYVRKRLAELPKVTCPEMGGAFYAFINIQAHLGRQYNGVAVKTSSQWCLELLAQQGVATVQGSAFGAEGYARLSYATSMKNIEAGLAAIDSFLRSAS